MSGAAPEWLGAGSLRGIWTRAAGAGHAVPRQSACATARIGLQGDCHADALSPRQVLLASDATYQTLALTPNALRENLLLDADVAALQSGALLAIGDSVVLRLMFLCEPCGQLNARHPGLANSIGRQRGMLARVLRGGDIGEGDVVRLLQGCLPAWPDDWRARLAMILAQMPAGMVVSYAQLAHIAGVPSGYCRAFPRALQALGLAALAVPARSVSPLPRWSGAEVYLGECAGLNGAG